MKWGLGARRATNQWTDEADQIVADEQSYRAQLQVRAQAARPHEEARRAQKSELGLRPSLPPHPVNTLARHICPQKIGPDELPGYLAGIAVHVPKGERITKAEDLMRLEAGDIIFDSIAVAAQFGVDLLHSNQGYISLMGTANEIIDESMNKKRRTRDPKRISEYVKDFLKRIVETFPVIIVRDLMGLNGRTTKGYWEVPRDRIFPPHHAAIIEINQAIVNRLVEARGEMRRNPGNTFAGERFHTLVFRLGVTLAHELCHVFTSYLLYQPDVHTPEEVTYGPYGTDTIGESGRYWESLVFGGYIDMRMGSCIERVAIRHQDEAKTAIIGPRAIKAMMYKDFTVLPILNHETWENSEYINQKTTLDWKLKYGDIFCGCDSPNASRPEKLSDAVLESMMEGAGMWYQIAANNLRSYALDSNAQIEGSPSFCWTLKAMA